MSMNILITGASGLIGTALKQYLASQGHTVAAVTRQRQGEGPFWDIDEGIVDFGNMPDPRVVIHLSGENISNGRWTKKRKQLFLDSRVNSTTLLAKTLSTMKNKPELLISGSAIGFYGDRDDECLDESAGPGDNFSSRLCIAWEAAAQAAADAGIRVANIRTGIVLAREGGALKKMLTPFKFGLGGKIGDGHQYMSWVSIDDYVRMIDFIIRTPGMTGPINMVAPNPVTNAEFTRTLARALHRPALAPMPAWLAKLLFGEMAKELLLASARVTPKKLLDAGYRYEQPELKESLQKILT